MFEIIKKLLGLKEKEEMAPYSYAEVELNPIAKSKGEIDDSLRKIKIFEGGKIKEEMDYTEELLEAIQKIDEIPINFKEFKEEEDFEFYPFEELWLSKYRKNV